MTNAHNEKVGSFWTRQPGIAIKGYIAIYGLTVVVNYVINLWMRAAPIGPNRLYWFDNICWMLFSLWWCFLFAAVGNWPFAAWIKNGFTRGVVATLACWFLGYLSYGAIYWVGLDIDWCFPIIGTLFALLVFFSYTGENWLWAGLSASRQFFLILVTVVGLTWLVVHTGIRWIPPWWFPFAQIFLATGLGNYLFRRVKQPGKTIGIWAIWFILIGIWLWISTTLGIWDSSAEAPGFWAIGSYNDTWLLFFFVYCSFVWGILVPAHNWPFRYVRMPWGGILAGAFCTVLSILITKLLLSMVGTVFADIQEAFTYGYMGVAWSFFVPLFFGVGLEAPVHWTGQEVPGSWEEVE